MKTEIKTSLAFRKYPSTTALQCFETAARHLSFTNAAQEMHMTQSAVSKQVSQLEEMLNLSHLSWVFLLSILDGFQKQEKG